MFAVRVYYMESAAYLPGIEIKDFALSCSDIVKSSPSKQEALKTVADFASPHLKKYLSITLKNPDEISMHFIDLLDQIVFEVVENIHYDDPVHEYIIVDLYARLCTYLDIFRGKETYTININKRNFTHDDTVIIRQCRMSEYVPLLVAEYYEQPILQKSILRALLLFDSENLLNLYYNIVKDGNYIEEKILALIGLKRFISKFNFDQLHSQKHDGYARLIEYAESFNCQDIGKNTLPEDVYSLLFGLNYIELNRDAVSDLSALAWMFRIIQSFLKIEFDNPFIADIYKSASNIILFAKPDILERLVNVEELAIAMIKVLDFFPGEFFYKLGIKLYHIGHDFIRMANRLKLSGKIKLNELESNTMNYILWESENMLQ